MSEPTTHVTGELLVRNPTAGALEYLLTRMVADPTEHPPATMAQLIMEGVGDAMSMQIGPGLEAETEEGENVVTLKWEFWI